jgi:phosphoglycerate kinase
VVEPLQQLLGRPVTFLEDCVGDGVANRVNNSEGEIFLCENVRFHAEEEGSVKDREGRKIKSKP